MNILASGIDWGTVPAWVGSVLTGSSLLLGFSILAGDRRQDRSAQARKIICYIQNRHDFNTSSGHVTVHYRNTSDQPIKMPILLADGLSLADCVARAETTMAPNKPQILIALRDAEAQQMLDAGTSTHFPGGVGRIFEVEPGEQRHDDIKTPLPAFCYQYKLLFTDANGQTWVRDFEFDRLYAQHASPMRHRVLGKLGLNRYVAKSFYPA